MSDDFQILWAHTGGYLKTSILAMAPFAFWNWTDFDIVIKRGIAISTLIVLVIQGLSHWRAYKEKKNLK
jgi:hypothetical protein